jgi:ketosteroid isomerase-like protein
MNQSVIRGRLQPVAAVVAATLLLGLPVRAMGPPRHHNRKQAHTQIEALEQQWRMAVLNNDVAGMDKLLSDDYLGITASGELVTKAQWLERMRTRNFMLTRLDASDVKIKLKGTIAIVTSFAQVEGTSDGKPLTGSFRYTRVYQRLPSGAWNITSFEATHIPRSGGHQRAGDDPGAGQH